MMPVIEETEPTTFLQPEHWDAMLGRIRRKEYRQLIQQFRDADNLPIARKNLPDVSMREFQDSIRKLGLGVHFLRKDKLRHLRRYRELQVEQRFQFVLSR